MNSPLNYLVTFELKNFVISNDFTTNLINKIVIGIKLRNDIIHKTKLDVTEKQATDTMENVKDMARVLITDLGQYYNQPP